MQKLQMQQLHIYIVDMYWFSFIRCREEETAKQEALTR